MIVWQRPNLLLLDEPTNHLDLATREALAMALNEFEGTVMLVSHDRALLRSVCDEFWMVSRGGVAPFDGDLDDYQRYLIDEAKRQREEIKQASSVVAQAAAKGIGKADARRGAKSAGEKAPLQSELEKLESRMKFLQAEGSALEVQLAAALRAAEIADLGQRLKTVNDTLADLEDRWLALSARLEAVGV